MLLRGLYILIILDPERGSKASIFKNRESDPMALKNYFQRLLARVESSDLITNEDKDKDGFFRPTRTILITHLHKLKDLHSKPLAKPMLKDSWKFVVEHVPPEWLVLNDEEKSELKEMLKP